MSVFLENLYSQSSPGEYQILGKVLDVPGGTSPGRGGSDDVKRKDLVLVQTSPGNVNDRGRGIESCRGKQ